MKLKQQFDWWLGGPASVKMFFHMLLDVGNAKKTGRACGKQYLRGRKVKGKIRERFHIDWGYAKDQGNILVIVDAGSCWIEAFPAGNRTSQTVKVHLSQIFARFGIPRILVSDNGSEFVSSDLKQWGESLGIKEVESPIYHPRAKGLLNERSKQWNGLIKPRVQIWMYHLALSYSGLWWHIGTLPRRGAKLL